MANWTDVAAWCNVLNPRGESEDFRLDLVMSANRVLDVGCGTGPLLRRASDQGHQGRRPRPRPRHARTSSRPPSKPKPQRHRQPHRQRQHSRNDKHIEWVLADAASTPWTEEFDLLTEAGFAIEEQFGGWRHASLTESSEEIVTIARKRVGNTPC
jgi:hypothetical protein